jgi:hypothetical protein
MRPDCGHRTTVRSEERGLLAGFGIVGGDPHGFGQSDPVGADGRAGVEVAERGRRAHELQYARSPRRRADGTFGGGIVIILGLILLVLGFFLKIQLLYIVGAILLVVGVVLLILGSTGRAIGGRRHYF